MSMIKTFWVTRQPYHSDLVQHKDTSSLSSTHAYALPDTTVSYGSLHTWKSTPSLFNLYIFNTLPEMAIHSSYRWQEVRGSLLRIPLVYTDIIKQLHTYVKAKR